MSDLASVTSNANTFLNGYQCDMPDFEGVLTDDEIASVLAQEPKAAMGTNGPRL